MSNQTFLYSTDKPTKPLYHECPDDGCLLMAAMSIPVFWYMLFDKTCLKRGPVHDDPKRTYLHLTATTKAALARAEKRWPAVSRVLGRGVEPLFRTWVQFVREHAKKYVHCETAEWYWMFDSHQKFAKELRTCLDAFQHVPKRRGLEVTLNRWWDQLLGQAHVDNVNGDLRPLGNNSYCGFSYGFRVPWSADEEEGCGAMRKELRDAPAVGKTAADIRGYLDRWGGVDEFRTAKCTCGSEVFRLTYHRSGAKRSCASCGNEHFLCDSEEWWEDQGGTLKEWKCGKCKSNVCNIGVGFSIEGGWVAFMLIGVRCGKCGRMERCTGLEMTGSEEMFDQV